MVGPDVTRPRPDDTNSIAYLKEFLAVGGGHIVNAVTFHQSVVVIKVVLSSINSTLFKILF